MCMLLIRKQQQGQPQHQMENFVVMSGNTAWTSEAAQCSSYEFKLNVEQGQK